MKIDEIALKAIQDSRGKDTLEATLKSGNFEANASVPSGKSTGATEAVVIDPQKAVEQFPALASHLTSGNVNFSSLEEFDKFLIELDGTPNKSNLGGNVMLALSMAFARLLAKSENLELYQYISKISGNQVKLPLCFFNSIEGGLHAENSLPFQEYLLIPQTNSPKESLETVKKAIELLRRKIKSGYGDIPMGDEGGFTVPSNDPLTGLGLLQELVDEDGLNVKIGLDVAASTMLKDEKYHVGDNLMSTYDLLILYEKIANDFTMLSMEDIFDEEDWQGFSGLTSKIGSKVWIVGDDLLTTNIERIKKAHKLQAVNAVIIKPNQIGTITEAIQAVNIAKSYGWKTIASHRAGETMDTFIADFAAGVGADGLKAGCPLQKERLVKYERLIKIEERIKKKE